RRRVNSRPMTDAICRFCLAVSSSRSIRAMITSWIVSTSLDHILRDAGLTDLEAELEQLAMNARRSPQGIFCAHPPDQRAQIRIDLRSASKRAGFPPPVPTEAARCQRPRLTPGW